MGLPFSSEQFFDVFGAYNAAVWPAVVVLWLATLFLIVSLGRGRANAVAIGMLASIHWLWSGVVYHALFFTAINTAAWVFAAVFVLEGIAFGWFCVRRRLTFRFDRTLRSRVGAFFLVYSLAYPFLAVLSGHQLLRVPLFAVPCPTTIFTVGLLLNGHRVPASLAAIPMLWSIVGGTAAFAFGVTPDLMLLAAVVALLMLWKLPSIQKNRRLPYTAAQGHASRT